MLCKMTKLLEFSTHATVTIGNKGVKLKWVKWVELRASIHTKARTHAHKTMVILGGIDFTWIEMIILQFTCLSHQVQVLRIFSS